MNRTTLIINNWRYLSGLNHYITNNTVIINNQRPKKNICGPLPVFTAKNVYFLDCSDNFLYRYARPNIFPDLENLNIYSSFIYEYKIRMILKSRWAYKGPSICIDFNNRNQYSRIKYKYEYEYEYEYLN